MTPKTLGPQAPPRHSACLVGALPLLALVKREIEHSLVPTINRPGTDSSSVLGSRTVTKII